MQIGGSSQESLRERLEREGEAFWGASRIDALRPGLGNLARDLWLVALQPGGPLEEIPDLFGPGLPAPEGDAHGTAL